MKSEEQRVKGMKNEEGHRDMWDTIKYLYFFKEIMVENFLN